MKIINVRKYQNIKVYSGAWYKNVDIKPLYNVHSTPQTKNSPITLGLFLNAPPPLYCRLESHDKVLSYITRNFFQFFIGCLYQFILGFRYNRITKKDTYFFCFSQIFFYLSQSVCEIFPCQCNHSLARCSSILRLSLSAQDFVKSKNSLILVLPKQKVTRKSPK